MPKNEIVLQADDVTLASVPHLHQWFGTWALLPDMADGFLTIAERLDLPKHLQAWRDKGEEPKVAYTVADGVATIELRGLLMKQTPSMIDGTSTVLARRAVNQAARDPNVKQILLAIDSPGGAFSGTADLADAVAAANKLKPVTALIEDLCASAAYFVASQAGRVLANESAQVGSIGTYLVVYDRAMQAAADGVKVHVIKAGAFKGVGVPGTEVTSEQLAELQRGVTEVNDVFLAAVARGRGLNAEQVAALATGQTWLAKKSQERGLIDGLALRESLTEELKQAASNPSRKPDSLRSKSSMAVEDIVAPTPATYDELKAELFGSDPAFRESCLDQKLTLPDARKAWMSEQQKRLDASRQETDAVKKAQAKGPGADAIDSKQSKEADGGGDPETAWNTAVTERAAKLGGNRRKAVEQLATEQPRLHQAYIAAYTARHPRTPRE